MQENIRIRNQAGICSIDIEGTIGVPEAWQFDDPDQRVATYDAFRDAVRRIGALDAEHVVVNIRSTGGDVNDALLIYEALTALTARITTRCYGYTASAATIIAQAASEGCRELSANALYLIHRSVCAAEGNADELEARIDLLRRTDERLVALYATRSQHPADKFVALMDENNGTGRWLSPDEAIDAGLADTLIGAEAQPKPSLVKNLLRGWRRLTQHDTPLPEDDRNILRLDDDPELLQAHSTIAMQQAQQAAEPTQTSPCEDPSVHEIVRSANAHAYAGDARRFAKF